MIFIFKGQDLIKSVRPQRKAVMPIIICSAITGRMKKILRAGVITVTGTEIVLMLMYAVFAPFLIDIFTDSKEVIDIGSFVLRRLMLILPFVGTVSMCRMSFQAMGKPQYAFGITLVRQLILYIPLLLLLDKCFGLSGMLWAQPITEAVMIAVSLIMLITVIRNISVKEKQE